MVKILPKALCHILIFFAFLCHATISDAQFRINGKLIDDNTDAPISSATVTLQDRNRGLTLAYDISSRSGDFKLELKSKPVGDLWLYFVAIGFHNDSIRFDSQPGDLLIRLLPFPKPLPPVTVKNRRSFRNIKPDTSSYKADDFVQKQDRTIEDVLKKIPGIEVDASGKIAYNGKAISNFYIDGDDIVSDRYTIATRAIRPEMVDKIQLINNHNPIKVLEAAVLSENTALNLSLKERARLSFMGDVGVGLGTHGTYKFDGDLLSFKQKFKVINLTKFNNAGIDIAQEIDIHNVADLLKTQEQNSIRPLLSTGRINSPDVAQQRYLFNKTGLLTLNYSVIPKPETQIKLNIHYLDDERTTVSNSSSVYFLPTAIFSYNEWQAQRIRSKSLSTQLTYTINNKKYYLNNVVSFNTAKPIGSADMQQNGMTFSQQYDNKNWNISDELISIRKNTGRNITEFRSFIQYKHSPENLKMLPGLNDSIFNVGIPYQALVQATALKGLFAHQSISYRIINDFLVQNYRAGMIMQVQKLESNISTVDNQGFTKQLADSFVNNLAWHQYRAYIKSDYDLVAGDSRISISVPFYLNYIKKLPGATDTSENFSKFVFSPSVRWRFDLNTENSFALNYQFNATPTSLEQNYSNYILKNYMSLQAWKLPVVLNSRHTASVNWIGRKPAKMLVANINLGFTTGENGYLSDLSYFKTLQVQTYLQSLVNNSSKFLNAGISKYVFAIHTTISGTFGLQESKYEQLQQKLPTRFSDVQRRVSVKGQSKINRWLTASYTMSYANGKSQNTTQDNLPEQKTSLLSQQMEINLFPLNGLSIKLSGENLQTEINKAQLANAFFSDVQIFYLIGKPKIEFSLEGTNVTANNNYTTVLISGNNTNSTVFPLRPFTIVASVKVRF